MKNATRRIAHWGAVSLYLFRQLWVACTFLMAPYSVDSIKGLPRVLEGALKRVFERGSY